VFHQVLTQEIDDANRSLMLKMGMLAHILHHRLHLQNSSQIDFHFACLHGTQVVAAVPLLYGFCEENRIFSEFAANSPLHAPLDISLHGHDFE